MTLRDHITPVQREAHAILDLVRAGVDVDDDSIAFALAVLGDLT